MNNTKKEMNILFASDKNFLYPTYVFLASIMENHKDITINFYMLAAEDVLNDDREKLRNYINSYNCNLEFLNIDSNLFNNYVLHEKFPRSAYYRLMAHKYLPQNMDRILYLDVDIIVVKDIYNEFYSLDFDDKYIITTSHNPNPTYCNMLTPEIVNLESAARGEYFNSGVILFNLEKFRKNIDLCDYNEAYKTCEKQNFQIFYDQGLLNYMFADKAKYLSSMDYNYRYSIPIQNKKRLEKDRVYKKAIIHYTGMCQPYKPWDLMLDDEDISKFGNVPFSNEYFYVSHELNDLLKLWWIYAEKTPIYENVLEQMKIKQKWFKRNLLDFMLAHNKLIDKYNNLGKNPTEKIIYKTAQSNLNIENFHWGAYKIGCKLLTPYYLFKKLIRKIKSKKASK